MNIKEWFEKGMPQNEQGQLTWVDETRKGDIRIISVAEPTKKEMKSREGFIVTLMVTHAIITPSAGKFQCWTMVAKCLATKGPNGLRFLWKVSKVGSNKEETLWGFSPPMLFTKLGMPAKYHHHEVQNVFELLMKQFKTEEVIPITKYLSHTMRDNGWAYLRTADLKALTSGPGTKHVLNHVYGRGRSLPKTAFGGIGEIRNLHTLKDAMAMVRIFKDCDPHVFAQMEVIYDVSFQTWHCVESYTYLVRFFRGTDKAVNFVLRALEVERDRFTARDTAGMLRRIRSRKVRDAFRDALRRNPQMTMRELHDMVDLETRRLATTNRPISSKGLDKFSDKVISPEIKCVTPKCTHDLVTWGVEYNICIGSYADAVLNNRTKVVGFQKPDGYFWGFGEITNENRLTQLLGKHNSPLPTEQRQQIVTWLETQGVNCDNYWGK